MKSCDIEHDKFKESMKLKKNRSRELYFKGYTTTQIVKVIDVKLATVKSWIYGQNGKDGWKVDKALTQNQLIKDLTEDKRHMVYSMVNGCMFLIHDYVEKLQKDAIIGKRSITLKEAEKLTTILGSLHKIIESEKDSSTDDGSFVKPTSVKELQDRIIKADPFAKPSEEIKEEVKKQNKKASESVKIHETLVEEIKKGKPDEVKDKIDSVTNDDDNGDWFS